MSASKGIRLWLRPAREGHAATYIIRDGERQKSTGCGAREIERANELLRDYINARQDPSEARNRPASQVFVADVISLYRQDVTDKRPRPLATRGRLTKLVQHLGDLTLPQIDKKRCRAYHAARLKEVGQEKVARAKRLGRPVTDTRTGEQSVRRELEDLRAALNHFFEDAAVPQPVNIWLPDKATARDVWLTETQAALFLWKAWRRSQPMPKGGKRFVTRHIARFTLVALYTGTRSAAICGAAIRPTEGRGYVDLDQGLFYRRPPGTANTTKRQTPVRLPDKLLNHLRRWARLGLCQHSIVEWEGLPVKRVSKAFARLATEAGLPKVTPHSLRHTSITWALQRGTKSYDASDYFAVSEKVIRDTYGHHHPDHHREVTSRMDRRKTPTPVAPPVAVQKRREAKSLKRDDLGG